MWLNIINVIDSLYLYVSWKKFLLARIDVCVDASAQGPKHSAKQSKPSAKYTQLQERNLILDLDEDETFQHDRTSCLLLCFGVKNEDT